MSFAEAQLAAHGVACFCRVLHCQAVLLEWNLDVKCFTMAWSLWALRVWLKVKKSAARLLLFTACAKERVGEGGTSGASIKRLGAGQFVSGRHHMVVPVKSRLKGCQSRAPKGMFAAKKVVHGEDVLRLAKWTRAQTRPLHPSQAPPGVVGPERTSASC